MTPGRLPDFVVIGAGKSGTTTLARWLGAQPEVVVSRPKEPRFFSDDERFGRGLEWYADLFSGATSDQIAGEASTPYTDPELAPKVAARMASVVPDARLIYLVRHPIHRLRSQFRFHVVQGVQRRPLGEALQRPDNRYVGRSLYHTCLSPFLDAYGRDAILVARFEDLVGEPAPAWDAVLEHLSLAPRPSPGTVHNATAPEPLPRASLRSLRGTGAMAKVPAPLRPIAKRMSERLYAKPTDPRVLATGDDPIPAAVLDRIWTDVAQLEARLGLTAPLWEREGPASG